ncbi:MAG: helix-turn-helix domain-containing protein [Melioribacteraceae bacterium]|nr:helix-turn-helix domain-containing protein [Melioribacteraceae bacterium]
MENRIVVVETDQLIELIKSAVNEALEKKEQNKNLKDLLNFKETCDFLGIHPSTLNKWKAENKIPFKRLGKRIFFTKEDILNSLKDSNYQKYKDLQSFIN